MEWPIYPGNIQYLTMYMEDAGRQTISKQFAEVNQKGKTRLKQQEGSNM